jgi:hypothetical protein
MTIRDFNLRGLHSEKTGEKLLRHVRLLALNGSN